MSQSAESSPYVSRRLQDVGEWQLPPLPEFSASPSFGPYVSRRLQDMGEWQLPPLFESPSASPSFGNSKRWRSCREVEEIRSPPPGCLSPASSVSGPEDEVSLPPEQTSAGDNPGADEDIVVSQSDAADSFEPDVRAFTFEEIRVATENFRTRADATGTVYTGILPDGCEIAAKTFLTSEVLLDNLQQETFLFSCDEPNIARLLGYCSERNEFMLIYEFMQSRTLANFLHHDGETRSQLNWERTYKICLGIAEGLAYLHNWERKYKICLGIAEGLAYLHNDSGMKVIHGDINPTNIFLDAYFNPKITNFPFSNCLNNNHIYSDTNTEELFKTLVEKDVYNYGLVILALVNGNCFSEANETLHHTYQLHEIINTRGNLLQFVDPRFGSAYSKKEAALLLDLCCSCTKDELRPSVTEILSSLKGERGLPELNHVQLQDDVITEMVNIDGGISSMVSVSDPLIPATKPLGSDSLKLATDTAGDDPLGCTNDIHEHFSVINAIQITDEPDGLGEAPSFSFLIAKVHDAFEELKTLVLGNTLKEALDDDNKSKILHLCEILDGPVLSEVQASLVRRAKYFLTFTSEFCAVRSEDSLYLEKYDFAKLKVEEIKDRAKNLQREVTSLRASKRSIKNDINHLTRMKTKMCEELIRLDEELNALKMRQEDEENKLEKIHKNVVSDSNEIVQLANWLEAESEKKVATAKRIKEAQERLDDGQEDWKRIQDRFG